MNIARTIYALRKENNLTQAQLAEKLGVSEQAVSKWENDQCAPDVSLFPLLADLFGVSIDRLFGYHEKSYDEGVEAIQKEADDSRDTRKEIEILQAGLKRYPNSPDLKLYLAFSLSMLYRTSRDESERTQAVERAIGLCREVASSRETKHADGAWNMLRRIYCEMGDFHAAEAAVDRISPDGYRQRIVGKAQVLECRKDLAEHGRFTEKHLFECYLAMDQLFELKRIALLEQRDWAGLLAWSRAHETLLSVFDAGCDDFFLCHKFWVCEAEARAYKGLGDAEGCRQAVSKLTAMASRMPAASPSEAFQIAARNPLYFSSLTDPDTQEEFMTTPPLQPILAPYAALC